MTSQPISQQSSKQSSNQTTKQPSIHSINQPTHVPSPLNTAKRPRSATVPCRCQHTHTHTHTKRVMRSVPSPHDYLCTNTSSRTPRQRRMHTSHLNLALTHSLTHSLLCSSLPSTVSNQPHQPSLAHSPLHLLAAGFCAGSGSAQSPPSHAHPLQLLACVQKKRRHACLCACETRICATGMAGMVCMRVFYARKSWPRRTFPKRSIPVH